MEGSPDGLPGGREATLCFVSNAAVFLALRGSARFFLRGAERCVGVAVGRSSGISSSCSLSRLRFLPRLAEPVVKGRTLSLDELARVSAT